jgi:hydrogenase maturation protein HypF
VAASSAIGGLLVRACARVEGTVQGVGFRPHVFRLARDEGINGYVLNDERGVLIEVEGDPGAVERFLARLSAEAPPLASIERVLSSRIAPTGEHGFRIVESQSQGEPAALVAQDSASCHDCLVELLDPTDRRFRYPFINCTNCGPRFTIVRGVPYDRRLTTMANFRMCVACRREYEDPVDRRFHAQPNACPSCGPRARLITPDGRSVRVPNARDPIDAAARLIGEGAIIAVKGLGGFHLACDAADEAAVATLRLRKHREDRPFAVMVRDVEAALDLIELGAEEERLLRSVERPIVLAPRCPGAGVADAVAPRARELGVMLPYTPIHHLLLADLASAASGPVSALVMTSGNVSDEPIAFRDTDAVRRLAAIADVFLMHDRPIHTRTDDSVVRVVRRAAGDKPLPLRRSRGFVPGSLDLPVAATRPLLACGAEQKNTFCVAKGSRAWVSHHIGDLEHFATLCAFREGIEHYERLFAVEPVLVVHDLHPDYLSTAYALEREDVELVGVQHHHAHLAACLAEHGLSGPAVGAIYDGTGYGTDGTIWGGELLVGGLAGFDREAHLWPVPMPGGSQAVREPWRMACAWLDEAFGEPRPLPRGVADHVDADSWRVVAQVARDARLSPTTTSMGRLFDAVGALCGVGVRASYEGQAAVELEAVADPLEQGAYELPFLPEDRSGPGVLDARVTVRGVVSDLDAGVPVPRVAARFHAAVADATAGACAATAADRGLDTVVLSGGVFQNRLLLERVAASLDAGGLRVLIPERLPPNDGGVSYGQAAVGAARDRVRHHGGSGA